MDARAALTDLQRVTVQEIMVSDGLLGMRSLASTLIFAARKTQSSTLEKPLPKKVVCEEYSIGAASF